MIKEYGGKEKYKSKTTMKKHEAKESKAMERKEKFKPCAGCPSPAKCAKMGMCMKKMKK